MSANLHTVTGHLNPVAPFNFARSLQFLGEFAPTLQEQTVASQLLTKEVVIGGQTIAFQVQGVGTTDEPKLNYTLNSEQPISLEAKDAAIDRIRFFLSLDDDLRPFYAIGQQDPHFAPVVQQLYGHHQVKFLTPFEIATWAILTQRNPMPVAHKMKQALVENYGGSIEINGATYGAFPEPQTVAAVDTETLATLLRHERKAEYIHAVATAFSQVDEHYLRTAPYVEVGAWLRKIKGIGDWSATFVLIRGLGRVEQVSGEKRLVERVHDRYGHDQRMEPIAEKYGLWQGYWAYYMRNAS